MNKKFLYVIAAIVAIGLVIFVLNLLGCGRGYHIEYGEGTKLSEVDIPVSIPYASNFACDYYASDGEKIEDKSTVFDIDDEIKVKVRFTLSADAYAAGKSKFTLKIAPSEEFDGRIYSANTSTTGNTELTATFSADDVSKNCEVEAKILFNYNSGRLRINYRYDDEEYAVATISPLNGSKPLEFTYDKETNGYVVGRDRENVCWFKDYTEFVVPSEYKGAPVTGIGESFFNDCKSLKSVTLPSTLKSIGEGAFYLCESLENITIPDGVTTIGNEAFYSCRSLKSVTIPDSVRRIGTGAFKYCPLLEEVILPAGIEDIGCDAFEGFNQLSYTEYDGGYYLGSPENEHRYLLKVNYDAENLTVHEDCEAIGRYAFNYSKRYNDDELNPKIKSVTLPSGVKIVGEGAFWECASLETATLSDSLTSIGNQAFYACTSLKSVTFGNNLEVIGDNAFWWCGKLTDMTLSDNVTYFGEGAFWACEKLYTKEDETGYYLGTRSNEYAVLIKGKEKTADGAYIENVRVNDECVMIGPSAFKDFIGIDTVVLPDSVKIIENSAFSGCSGLENIEMPSVTRVGDSAFAGCKWKLASVNMPSVKKIGEEAFRGCVKLTSVEMPSVTSIGSYAFSGCFDGVEEFTVPNGITSIGAGAFAGCDFKIVTLPESVKSIGEEAFHGCDNLETVNFPESLIEIGDRAFEECESLKTVILPDSVVSIGEEAFKKCPSLTTVSLPANLEKVKYATFSGCESLATVTIKGNINGFESEVFNWSGLKEITFIGTRKAWLDILSLSDTKNLFCHTITARCKDGDLFFDAYEEEALIYLEGPSKVRN